MWAPLMAISATTEMSALCYITGQFPEHGVLPFAICILGNNIINKIAPSGALRLGMVPDMLLPKVNKYVMCSIHKL